MADRQITDLPTVVTLTGTELMHTRQGGTDKTALMSQVNSFINDKYDTVPASGSINPTDTFIMRVSAATKKVTAAILKLFILDGNTIGNAAGEIPVSNGTKNVNLNADLLDGLTTGNGSGQIPINNGTVCTNLNADLLDSLTTGNGSGQIPISNTTKCINLNADAIDGFHAGNASGQVPINNGVFNGNLNAGFLGGFQVGHSTGQIPISDGFVNTNLRAAVANNADLLDGLNSGNASGNIPISNGTVNTNLRAAVANNADAVSSGVLLHNFFDSVSFSSATIGSTVSTTIAYPATFSISNCVVLGCVVGDNTTVMRSLGEFTDGVDVQAVSVTLNATNITIQGSTFFTVYRLILARTS